LADLYQYWPSFRGPGGNGIATTTEAPLRWDGPANQGILWKAEIPLPGFNSPIVWEERVFLSGADETTQAVYCFDAASGEALWQREVRTAGTPDRFPEVTSDTGYAAPSMATDGQRVFAIFTTGDIIGLDLEGRPVWSRNLGIPDNHYGHSSSLITHGEALLVQYDHAGGPRLIALDTVSGDLLWETKRDVQTSWASPIIVQTGNRFEVILNTNPIVASYDPATGKELWAVDCMMGEVAPSPAYAGGVVFAVNQNAILCAIDPESSSIVWEAEDDLPDVSSPLATEDFVFLLTSYGVVTCYDTRDGKMIWNHEFEEGFYSSPILAGGLVYALDMSGVMRIFKASAEFDLVASPELGEKSMCTPAFVKNRIFIRGDQHLYCIEEGR
jgi:outer membrane protein assembly factor BamB